MGLNCLNATESLRGGSLLFTRKFPEIHGTHLIDLGKMNDRVDLGATQWFSEHRESSGLTSGPFLEVGLQLGRKGGGLRCSFLKINKSALIVSILILNLLFKM